MWCYQQKFSESQGGRKEGHRIQYLPPPCLDSRDNDAPRKGSDVTRDTWSPPWGGPPMMMMGGDDGVAAVLYSTVHMCNVPHCTAGVSLSETVAVTTCALWTHFYWQLWNVKTFVCTFFFLLSTFKKPMGWKNCRACLNFMILLWCQSLYKNL